MITMYLRFIDINKWLSYLIEHQRGAESTSLLYLLLHLSQTARKGTASLLDVMVLDITTLTDIAIGVKGIQQEQVVQFIMELVYLDQGTVTFGCLSSIEVEFVLVSTCVNY